MLEAKTWKEDTWPKTIICKRKNDRVAIPYYAQCPHFKQKLDIQKTNKQKPPTGKGEPQSHITETTDRLLMGQLLDLDDKDFKQLLWSSNN